MTRSPTVPTTTVHFAEDSRKADDLEAVVVTAEKTTALDAEEIRKNMEYVTEEIAQALNEYVDELGDDEATNFTEEAKKLLPYVAGLKMVNKKMVNKKNREEKIYVFTLEKIPGKMLGEILEAIYGEDIRKTGVYEAVGLDQEKAVAIEALAEYLPEVAAITAYKGKEILVPADALNEEDQILKGVAEILLLPVEVRPFVAGVLRIGDAIDRSDKYLSQLCLTRDVIAYAKQVNQLGEVAKYLKLINGGKKVKSQ